MPQATIPQQPRAPARRPRRQTPYTPLAEPLSAVLPKVQALLQYPPTRPTPNPLPQWYNPALYCHFHRTAGHSTDGCHTLRDAIQDLIDNKSIVVQNSEAPASPQPQQVEAHPLPTHEPGPSRVNLISIASPSSSPSDIDPLDHIGTELPSFTDICRFVDQFTTSPSVSVIHGEDQRPRASMAPIVLAGPSIPTHSRTPSLSHPAPQASTTRPIRPIIIQGAPLITPSSRHITPPGVPRPPQILNLTYNPHHVPFNYPPPMCAEVTRSGRVYKPPNPPAINPTPLSSQPTTHSRPIPEEPT
jgi:hypothetical protein